MHRQSPKLCSHQDPVDEFYFCMIVNMVEVNFRQLLVSQITRRMVNLRKGSLSMFWSRSSGWNERCSRSKLHSLFFFGNGMTRQIPPISFRLPIKVARISSCSSCSSCSSIYQGTILSNQRRSSSRSTLLREKPPLNL